jgi:AraC-like DNA-binding protein
LSGLRDVKIAATMISFDEVMAGKAVFPTGARFHQDGDLDGLFVHLPSSGQALWQKGSEEFVTDPTTGFIGHLNSKDITDLSNQASVLLLMIPYACMVRSLSQILDEPIYKPLEFHPTFDARTQHVRALSALVQVAADPVAGAASIFASPIAAHHFGECLISYMLENFQHNYSAGISPSGRAVRPQYIRRAIEYMHAHADKTQTLERIAEAANISVRALQYGFKQHLGVSPFEYLRRIRLKAAYSELVSRSSDLSIVQIARKWGFPNAGRFAQLCRGVYGVGPSEIRRMKSGKEPR